jgi:glyoxylase-like metal-dependent hydrolase (beta-lactamase superfamily II)
MTWTWTVLRAGAFRLDGGGMFGLIPRVMWTKLVQPDAENRIPLQTNCLLLESEGRRVLVETGFGGKWTDKERAIWDLERRSVVDALREVDLSPESIDAVIVTHLHFDHAGGLTGLQDGVASPVFARAEVIVQRQEWEDALANRSTMTKTYLRSHLDPIADRLRLVDQATEVLPGIRVRPMPGHTWGQQAVLVDTADGHVCFPGDVLPTAHHAPPAFSMAYDMLPYQNMLSKQALLEEALHAGWTFVLDHEPGFPIRRAARDASSGRVALAPAHDLADRLAAPASPASA